MQVRQIGTKTKEIMNSKGDRRYSTKDECLFWFRRVVPIGIRGSICLTWRQILRAVGKRKGFYDRVWDVRVNRLQPRRLFRLFIVIM